LARSSPDDGAAGVGVGVGAGVADGCDEPGDLPSDDGGCEADDGVLADDEEAPVVLAVEPELDVLVVLVVLDVLVVLSEPCENVPRLRFWSRSSSSAWLL
jgi:hypothetical protein